MGSGLSNRILPCVSLDCGMRCAFDTENLKKAIDSARPIALQLVPAIPTGPSRRRRTCLAAGSGSLPALLAAPKQQARMRCACQSDPPRIAARNVQATGRRHSRLPPVRLRVHVR